MNKYNDILEGMRNIYSAKLVTMELEGKHEEVSYCLGFINRIENADAWHEMPNNYGRCMCAYDYCEFGVDNLIMGIAHSYGYEIHQAAVKDKQSKKWIVIKTDMQSRYRDWELGYINN